MTEVIQQVAIVVPANEVEVASDRLWQLGILGIEEFEGTQLASGEPSASVCLVATPEDGDVGPILEAFRGYTTSVIDVDHDTYAGFLDGWREFAEPVWAGDRVVLWPAWWPVPDRDVAPDAALVVIEPGHAFGSGSHPTTLMAASALADHVRSGVVVLDVGCGSGVLAVAAALLGAARVVATDVDPDAVTISKANAIRNEVTDLIECSVGSVPDGEQFDVVIANISAGVLIDSADALAGALAPNGVLLLTGILAERSNEVVTAFAGVGRSVEHEQHDDGWVLLTLR